MSGEIEAIIPGLAISIGACSIGICYGAAKLIQGMVKVTAQGIKRGKEKVDEAVEHKRQQITNAIDEEAQQAITDMFQTVDSLRNGLAEITEKTNVILETAKNKPLEVKGALTDGIKKAKGVLENKKISTQRIRKSILQKEDEIINKLIDKNTTGKKLEKAIQEIEDNQNEYLKIKQELNDAYVKEIREEAKFKALKNVTKGLIDNLTSLISRNDLPNLNELRKIEKQVETDKIEDAYKMARDLMDKLRSGKDQHVSMALDNMQTIRTMTETLVFHSYAKKREIEERKEKLHNLLLNNNFSELSKETASFIQELEERRVHCLDNNYRERNRNYNNLLNRYFYFEEPFDLKGHKLEELAVTLDEIDYGGFDKIYNEIEGELGQKGRETIARITKEVLQEQKFDHIEVSETEMCGIQVNGSKGIYPLTMTIDPKMNIRIKFHEEAMESDQVCHKEIMDFFRSLKKKLLNNGLEINLGLMALNWRAQRDVKEIVNGIVEERKEDLSTKKEEEQKVEDVSQKSSQSEKAARLLYEQTRKRQIKQH